MPKVPQLKKLSLAAVSAVVLTTAVAGVAAAAPCLFPTPDCAPLLTATRQGATGLF